MKRLGFAAALLAVVAPFPGTPPGRAQSSATPAPASTLAADDPSPGVPVLEPYRFNPRERTARALAAWEKGRIADAVAPLDSALRLQPGDPLVEFNAGTAHLGANRPDAAQLLEQAAKHAPPGLAADAFYNLGNARLEAKEAQPAIDAYKSALRAQSDLPNAKRNLELALRLLEEQQRQQEQQQQDSQDKQNQQQQPGGGQEQKPDQDQQPKPDPRQPPDPQQDAPQSGGAAEDQPQAGQPPPPKERPLPQFEEQKDMTAEQAAAILQAVENLERQQRREQARALARAKTSVEKDW